VPGIAKLPVPVRENAKAITLRLSCAAALVASGAALANVGSFSAIGVEGGAVLAKEEVPGVGIAAEVVDLRAAPSRGQNDRVNWNVTYRFVADAPRVVDVAFPVELQIADNFEQPGDDIAIVAWLLTRLANEPDGASWQALASAAERLIVEARDNAMGPELVLPFEQALAAHAPLRLTVSPSDLEHLGVEGFAVHQGESPVTLGTVLVEARAETRPRREFGFEPDLLAHPSRSVHAADFGSVLGLTLTVPFELTFPKGESELYVGWVSPVLEEGAFGLENWSARYLLGPGRTWSGPVGRIFVAVDRDLLRGRTAPELPFPASPWSDGNRLVWEVADYEPAEDDRVEVGGWAVFPTGLAHNPSKSLEDSLDLTWETGHAPSLPVGEATASTVKTGQNYAPLQADGTRATDLGFGPENLLDGSEHSGWCGDATGAWVEFTLPRAATGLDVAGGNRNPWFLEPCTGEEGEVDDGVTGDPRLCVQLFRGSFSPSDGRPATATLTDAGGRSFGRLLFGRDARATLSAPLPPGRYRLTIDAVAKGPPTPPAEVCIAEITPKTVVDPVFRSLAPPAR
jgi:hypothetical protein